MPFGQRRQLGVELAVLSESQRHVALGRFQRGPFLFLLVVVVAVLVILAAPVPQSEPGHLDAQKGHGGHRVGHEGAVGLQTELAELDGRGSIFRRGIRRGLPEREHLLIEGSSSCASVENVVRMKKTGGHCQEPISRLVVDGVGGVQAQTNPLAHRFVEAVELWSVCEMGPFRSRNYPLVRRVAALLANAALFAALFPLHDHRSTGAR